ncbi:aconitase X [Halostagnicola bangensis]
MELDPDERAMLNGEEGPAKQVAMDLLIRYAEALDVDRLINTDNVAGVPGAVNEFLENYYGGGSTSHNEIFSRYDLDSDRVVDVPDTEAGATRLQGKVEPKHWDELGTDQKNAELDRISEEFAADHDVEVLKTCTPYHAGNLPSYGEHCAWMESSAVVFINSVLGARTNVEGRESTSAAMLTGKIPDWGLHRDENRYGTHRIEVDVPVDDIMNWGMLGYFVGKHIQEDIPVLVGDYGSPSRVEHKHFGASAATSGGIELYHVVGETPEAETEASAFGPNEPEDVYRYDEEACREVYDELNAVGDDRDIDFVMLGCPHYSIEQVREASRLLEGRELDEDVELWLFASRKVRDQAEQEGHADVIRAAGGKMMTDTCSSMSQAIPPETDVVALDSAKQVHYLPAIMDVEAWFGSTEDVIDAAISGSWDGERP